MVAAAISLCRSSDPERLSALGSRLVPARSRERVPGLMGEPRVRDAGHAAQHESVVGADLLGCRSASASDCGTKKLATELIRVSVTLICERPLEHLMCAAMTSGYRCTEKVSVTLPSVSSASSVMAGDLPASPESR
jgi:hypothetical protein